LIDGRKAWTSAADMADRILVFTCTDATRRDATRGKYYRLTLL
jgi:alkylation response protein AidB-like acyl-CoA dehydrogenase